MACLVAAAWGGAHAEVSVALRARARPAGALVTLGDVARIEAVEATAQGGEAELDGGLARRASRVPLGAAPRPGGTRTISRRLVASRLQQEGIAAADVVLCGERRVIVSPRAAGETARLEDGVARALRAHVAAELGCAAESLEVSTLGFHWIGRPPVSQGLELAVSRRAKGSGLGRASYVLDCRGAAGGPRGGRGGRLVGRMIAWTDSVLYRAAVVSRRSVKEGEEIDPAGLVTVTVPVRRTGARLLAEPERAASRVAARSLEAGEPLDERAFTPRQLVRRGETVTVVVEAAGLRITSRARAARSGSRGEVIPIENTGSGREFLARVVGENVVVAVP